MTSDGVTGRPIDSDFRFGAAVFSADGKHIGTLRRVIVDQESLDLHAIVVKETRRFSGHYFAATGLVEDDIAIPLNTVRSVSPERIDLSIDSSEARRTAPYLTYQYAPQTRSNAVTEAVALVGQSAYIPHLVEEAHKRLDEMEIDPGENIMLGKTGKKLGTVRDIVTDEGELVGVVMHPVGFFKEDVLLQVRFLGRSDDLALFAYLTEGDIAHLQPFHPDR